jgi:hypothetical protein
MARSKNTKAALIALAFTLALMLQLTPPPTADGSDHIDSPTLAQDHASDINDAWFFLDPNDNTKVVMIMTTNPFLISSEIIGQAIFDHNIRYRFEIENNGDARTDLFIDVTFDRYVGREVQPGQMATITLPTGRSFRAELPIPTQGADRQDITPPPLKVTADAVSGVSFFAGATDDPFFLDNTAANRFVLSSVRNPGNPNRAIFRNRAGFDAPDASAADADQQVAGQLPNQAQNQGQNQGPGRDTYSGFNTLLIAVSVPASMLRGAPNPANGDGNIVGLNAVTQRRRQQIFRRDGQFVGAGPYVTVDREGVPLVNNGLIPPPRKDEYNGATPLDDANGKFRADLIQSINNFGTNEANRNMLLKLIQENGDILRLDLRVPNSGPGGGNNVSGGFPNPANNFAMGGRRLQDDVADLTFTLLNNGQPLGDFVDRNDFAFGNTFPFVAPQVMPNPNGINSRDTRVRL